MCHFCTQCVETNFINKDFLVVAPCKGLFGAMLHSHIKLFGLRTTTGRRAGQKAIYTSVTGGLELGTSGL